MGAGPPGGCVQEGSGEQILRKGSRVERCITLSTPQDKEKTASAVLLQAGGQGRKGRKLQRLECGESGPEHQR